MSQRRFKYKWFSDKRDSSPGPSSDMNISITRSPVLRIPHL